MRPRRRNRNINHKIFERLLLKSVSCVQTPLKGVKKNILHDRDWFSGSPRLDIMSMSRIVDEVLAANHAYSESFGAKGQLGMPPRGGSRF